MPELRRLSKFLKRIKPKPRPEELPSRVLEENEVSAQDELCVKCTRLNLSMPSFYVLGAAQDTMVTDALELGTIAQLRKRKLCPLCRLVLRSLDGHHPAHLQTFGSDLPFLKCKLVWNSDRFSGIKEKELVRLKRHLSLLFYTDGSHVPVHVPLRLVPLSQATAVHDSFGLAMKAESVDFELVQSWIRDCESTHGCVSSIRSLAEPPVLQSHFIVLDVQRMCLVRVGIEKCRFLALSYVWGADVEDFRTTQANVGELMLERGLEIHLRLLPTTIRDAFELVLKLGERYIWIDKLCIVQDDLVNKQDILDAMGTIYGKALVTIIPADSNTAADGIAGLSQATAVRGQITERINEDLELIALPDLVTKLEKSCYSTRAWTYQEIFFAARRLFLIDGRALFVCSKSTFREDVCAIDRKILCVEDHEENLFSTRLGLGFDYRFAYGTFVTNYSRRQLSYDSDALNAFSGFISLLTARNRLRFYFGLPESHLDSSILWQPSQPLQRRQGPFPSWSWCAWSGAVNTNVIMWHPQHVPRDAPKPDWIIWYAWYLTNATGAFEPVKGPEIIRITNTEPHLETEPTEQLQAQFRNRKATDININGLLTFWTLHARFRLCTFPQSQTDPHMSIAAITKGGSSLKESSRTTLLGLEDRNGQLCGAVYLNTDSTDSTTTTTTTTTTPTPTTKATKTPLTNQTIHLIAIRESMESLLRQRRGYERDSESSSTASAHRSLRQKGDDAPDERVVTRTNLDHGGVGFGFGVFEVLVVAERGGAGAGGGDGEGEGEGGGGVVMERVGVGEVYKQAFRRACGSGCWWAEVVLG